MEFLEVPLFDDDIFKLGVRFLLDVFFLILVVSFAVYPHDQKRDFTFTVVMMNVMVFFICFTLKKLDLGLGMALGLFAIFAVLRYRTDAIKAKEMTYLFIVIGIAVINALSNKKTSYVELVAVNLAVVAAAALMERFASRDRLRQHTLSYDRLDLLAPHRRDELLADLKERTGLDICKVEVARIDLRKSSATLTIDYYIPKPSKPDTGPAKE
ncbi:MAG: DUF4956 domain-containing protein [Pirellulaceae bacterium]